MNEWLGKVDNSFNSYRFWQLIYIPDTLWQLIHFQLRLDKLDTVEKMMTMFSAGV